MNRSVMSAALIAAATMAGMGQSAEVIQPQAASGSVFAKGRRTKVQRQRLQRATGPGSLNETNELKALIWSDREAEAAAYYELCREINYRAGRPKMRWGDVWYHAYKVRVAVARAEAAQS